MRSYRGQISSLSLDNEWSMNSSKLQEANKTFLIKCWLYSIFYLLKHNKYVLNSKIFERKEYTKETNKAGSPPQVLFRRPFIDGASVVVPQCYQ